MMCTVSTRVRYIARSANDAHPIEQHDAVCDQHGVVSPNWTTQAGAQGAAELHQATAAYGTAVSRR
jgi:hypothetical protein